MKFSLGQRVLIAARVQQLYHADREESWQSLGLQLTDGQHLITNVRNCEPEARAQATLPETLPLGAAVASAAAAGALKAQPKAKDKAVKHAPANKAIAGPED
jgi:hypothetical protein